MARPADRERLLSFSLTEVEAATPQQDLLFRDRQRKKHAIPSTATFDGADKAYAIVYKLLSSTLLPRQARVHLAFLDALFYVGSAAELDQVLPELQDALLKRQKGNNLLLSVLANVLTRWNCATETKKQLMDKTALLFHAAPQYSTAARDLVLLGDYYASAAIVERAQKSAEVTQKRTALEQKGMPRETLQSELVKFLQLQKTKTLRSTSCAHYTDLLSELLGQIVFGDAELKRGAFARAVVNAVSYGIATKMDRWMLLQQVTDATYETALEISLEEMLEMALHGQHVSELTKRLVSEAHEMVDKMLIPHAANLGDKPNREAVTATAQLKADRLSNGSASQANAVRVIGYYYAKYVKTVHTPLPGAAPPPPQS